MQSSIFQITLFVTEGVTGIIPFVSLFFCYRKYNPSYMRSLPIYFFGNALAEAFGFFHQTQPTAVICYTIFEMLYFAYFLTLVVRSLWVRKTIRTLAILFTLSMLYTTYKGNTMYTSFWADILKCCILIFPCIYYFKEILTERKIPNLFRDPSFWMVIGILYYFLVTIPIWLFTMYFDIHDGHLMASEVWSANSYAELISFSLFIYAMICNRPRSTKQAKGYFRETNVNTAA